MKIQLMMVLTAFCFTVAVNPVYAENTGKYGSKAAEVRERVQEKVSTRLQTKAQNEIARRLKSLTNLIEKINMLKRLTVSQKAELTVQVQKEIDSLNALKTKIASETDMETLRADVQSIVKSYRIYALFIPKIQIISHAERLLNVIEDMKALTTKLQERIDAAAAAGKNVSGMTSLMSDRTIKISDAATQAQNAVNAVLPLTPDGYPGNKTTLQSARTMLQTARQDLVAAQKDANQIRQQLKELRISPTAAPTP